MKSMRFYLAVIFAIIVSGCFSPWKGDEGAGTFSIGVGSEEGETDARFLNWGVVWDLVHTIRLSGGPGPDQVRTVTHNQTMSFSVAPGHWNISVEARKNGELIARGFSGANIRPGPNGMVSVQMRPELIWKEEVSDWQGIAEIVSGSVAGSEIVILIKNDYHAFNTFNADDKIVIGGGKQITLVANDYVTIHRDSGFNDSFFSVEGGGTLTLGKTGMAGSITINGDDTSSIAEPLVRVDTDGILVMNAGVELTKNNNTTTNTDQMGGAVNVFDGTFTMNGGTISGNTAARGGGVYVSANGIFTKTKGVIYGGNDLINANTATITDGGNAVYVALHTGTPPRTEKVRDDTIGNNDSFTSED